MQYKVTKKRSGDFEINVAKKKTDKTFNSIEDAVKHISTIANVASMFFELKGEHVVIAVKVGKLE